MPTWTDGNPQILYHAGHYRRVRMRRAVVCVTQVGVSVDLQDAHIVIFFVVGLDDREPRRNARRRACIRTCRISAAPLILVEVGHHRFGRFARRELGKRVNARSYRLRRRSPLRKAPCCAMRRRSPSHPHRFRCRMKPCPRTKPAEQERARIERGILLFIDTAKIHRKLELSDISRNIN